MFFGIRLYCMQLMLVCDCLLRRVSFQCCAYMYVWLWLLNWFEFVFVCPCVAPLSCCLCARKRYNTAEAEFVASKLHLHRCQEQKELLTEHLFTIIQQNEVRKARKIAELMGQLEMEGVMDEADLPTLPPLPLLHNDVEIRAVKPEQTTAKDREGTAESEESRTAVKEEGQPAVKDTSVDEVPTPTGGGHDTAAQSTAKSEGQKESEGDKAKETEPKTDKEQDVSDEGSKPATSETGEATMHSTAPEHTHDTHLKSKEYWRHTGQGKRKLRSITKSTLHQGRCSVSFSLHTLFQHGSWNNFFISCLLQASNLKASHFVCWSASGPDL